MNRYQDTNRLDEPGKPLIGKVRNKDGSESPFEIPQTKGDNCASAAIEAGGADKVTDSQLAKWDLTRDDYNEFRMDHAKELQRLKLHQESDELLLDAFSRPPDRDAYIEALKRLMPDDWQKHVPPA
jgi:hypothetical protein